MRCHRRRRATPQMCRNPLAPFGLGAVSGPLQRSRSSTMTRIAYVAAPCIAPESAPNATHRTSTTGC